MRHRIFELTNSNVLLFLKMLYLYRLHAGSSLILLGYISLDEYYHVSPVNICWLRHSTGACLDINLVFCYHIATHSFNMYVYSMLYDTWIL